MLTTAMVMLLCASPVRIAATSFTVHGDAQAKADAWLDRFAEVMRRDQAIEVTTPSQIAQLLGMERQRQLTGCNSDATECMAELAAALGAEGILYGTVTKSGDSYLAVVRLIRQSTGKVWWSASTRVKSEAALLDWFDEQAPRAADAVLPRQGGTVAVAPLVVGGAGLVAAGVGAALLVVANTETLAQVRNAGDVDELRRATDAGKLQSGLGVGLVAVGGAALVTSVVWFVAAPKPGAPTAMLVPLQDGIAASVGGVW